MRVTPSQDVDSLTRGGFPQFLLCLAILVPGRPPLISSPMRRLSISSRRRFRRSSAVPGAPAVSQVRGPSGRSREREDRIRVWRTSVKPGEPGLHGRRLTTPNHPARHTAKRHAPPSVRPDRSPQLAAHRGTRPTASSSSGSAWPPPPTAASRRCFRQSASAAGRR